MLLRKQKGFNKINYSFILLGCCIGKQKEMCFLKGGKRRKALLFYL